MTHKFYLIKHVGSDTPALFRDTFHLPSPTRYYHDQWYGIHRYCWLINDQYYGIHTYCWLIDDQYLKLVLLVDHDQYYGIC